MYCKLTIGVVAICFASVLFFALDLIFGNPQKSKYHFIVQKLYLGNEIELPKTFSGVWREWEGNGALIQEANYKEGLLNGIRKTFDDKSVMLQKESFEMGELHGPMCFYYENGNLKSISNWNKGVQVGQSKGFYEDGQVMFKCSYINNKLNGQYATYFENGAIEILGNFENGEFVNIWNIRNGNGQIIKRFDCSVPIERKEIEEFMIDILKVKS